MLIVGVDERPVDVEEGGRGHRDRKSPVVTPPKRLDRGTQPAYASLGPRCRPIAQGRRGPDSSYFCPPGRPSRGGCSGDGPPSARSPRRRALWTSTSAWASSQRLGTAASSVAHTSCPALPCQALTRTTGFQASIGGSHNAMVVGRAGRVVSWTITLSKPNADEVSFFDQLPAARRRRPWSPSGRARTTASASSA